jgi:hypothetical protein
MKRITLLFGLVAVLGAHSVRESAASPDNPVQGETRPAVLAKCLKLHPADQVARSECISERERMVVGFLETTSAEIPELSARCRADFANDVFGQFDCVRVAAKAVSDVFKPYATSSP